MNVFELADQYRHLEELLDLTDDEQARINLQIQLDQIEDAVEVKAENIAYMIKNREAALEGMLQANTALQKRMAQVQFEITRLKGWAQHLLQVSNRNKIEGKYLVVQTVANKPRVEVVNPSALPQQFLRYVEPVEGHYEPDKAKLYDAMKEGEIIEGAKLVASSRLVIK